MFIFKNNDQLQSFIGALSRRDSKVGFVPTMGALHEGHLSLLAFAKKECDFVITSIFVNPTQFNDVSDLKKYPRTLEADINILAQAGNDLLFIPENTQIYPADFDQHRLYDLNGLDNLLEGAFRPGHFNGVALVVHRLLDIVQPDALYMGQKDYQQVAIIRQLIASEKLKTKLVMCPIVRDANGLALSSRNARLSPQWKEKALILSATLRFAQAELKGSQKISQIESEAKRRIEQAGLKIEYFSIINGKSLQPGNKRHRSLVAVTAAWAGDVRLIDNMVLSSVFNQID